MKRFLIILITICYGISICTFQAAAFGGDVNYANGGGGHNDRNYDNWDGGTSRIESGNINDMSFLLVFCILVAIHVMGQIKSTSTDNTLRELHEKELDEDSIYQLRLCDPSFVPLDIEMMVREWISLFEDAWCHRDMSPYAHLISDGLFDTYQKQLDQLINDKHLPKTTDLSILECIVEKYYKNGVNEYLDIWIVEKKKTFIVSDYDSMDIVKGNFSTVYKLFYRWQLVRTSGINEEWKLNKVDKLGQIDQ